MGDGTSAADRAMKALDWLSPPAPAVDNLLSELSFDEVRFSSLARLVERDSFLTGAVLRRANSAIYHRGSPVRSVLRALTLLGIDELRHLALSLSVASSLPRTPVASGFSRGRYVRHHAATAIMADLLDRRLASRYGASAATAGLLHDVSRLLVAVAIPAEFQRIVESGTWSEDRAQEILGVGHPQLSARILEAWKAAPEVSQAVAEHHSPDTCGRPLPLAAILGAADNYTAVLLDQDEASAAACDECALTGLGIDAAIPQLVEEFQTRFRGTCRQ